MDLYEIGPKFEGKLKRLLRDQARDAGCKQPRFEFRGPFFEAYFNHFGEHFDDKSWLSHGRAHVPYELSPECYIERLFSYLLQTHFDRFLNPRALDIPELLFEIHHHIIERGRADLIGPPHTIDKIDPETVAMVILEAVQGVKDPATFPPHLAGKSVADQIAASRQEFIEKYKPSLDKLCEAQRREREQYAKRAIQ